MTSLIIGGAGFVGGYLAQQLASGCGKIHATCLPGEKLAENVIAHELNILDKDSIKTLLSETVPDVIFHLAAQSSVALSWKNPQLTVDINIKGTLNVLDAMRETASQARILLIGSGEEYGHIREGACPVCEDECPRPGNIYAATKACQSMIGDIYAKAYNMDIVMVRAFNHIGPHQHSQFVVADFCKQVAEIEKGASPEIRVGNLSAKRDFTDVRDVVRAYDMLAKHGKSGHLYNVGSGKAVEIGELLRLITAQSTGNITVTVDENKFRPIDIPIIEADIGKITADTGWTPQISLEQTVTDTLNYWRGQYA